MRNSHQEIAARNDLEDLTRIYSGIDDFAAGSVLSDGTRRVLYMIAEELFTNVVYYGYDDGQGDQITFTLDTDGDEIRMLIRDHAKAFDVSALPDKPDQGANAETMPIGGLGLFLVHQFASSVANRRDGDANVTEIRLPRSAGA